MSDIDPVALLGRSVDETIRMIDGVKPEQWSAPTLCAGWTVRDLVNHVTAGGKMFAYSAAQGSLTQEQLAELMGDNLGDDPPAAFRGACGKAMDAFAQPGILDKTVELPFGTMPAGVAATIAVFDLTTHAADLAHATGQTNVDQELIATALGIGQQMIGPDMRQPGLFDAEQTTSSASISDQLLAFAGRKI